MAGLGPRSRPSTSMGLRLGGLVEPWAGRQAELGRGWVLQWARDVG